MSDDQCVHAQVTSAFLQGILQASVRDSLVGLRPPALEVLYVAVLFPTGAPALLSVIAEVWSAGTAFPGNGFWVGPFPLSLRFTIPPSDP